MIRTPLAPHRPLISFRVGAINLASPGEGVTAEPPAAETGSVVDGGTAETWRSIPDVEWWLDASDASTITDTAGAVTAWADKSGNGHDFDQDTGADRPTTNASTQNGLNVIDFDADFLESTEAAAAFNFLHAADVSIFAVWKPGLVANPDAAYGLMGSNGSASGAVGLSLYFDDRSAQSRQDQLVGQVGTGAGSGNFCIQEVTAADTVPANTWQMLSWRTDVDNGTAAARSELNVDGAAVGGTSSQTQTATSADSTYLFQLGTVGNDAVPLVGQLAEVVTLNRRVTDTERDIIESYLAAKWGVAPSSVLPAESFVDGGTAADTPNSYIDGNARPVVTGGTLTTPGDGYQYRTFTADGTLTVTGGSLAIDFLLVAGGGQGGNNIGGGGGAGGVIDDSTTLAAGSYPIVIGAGGSGAQSSDAGGADGDDSTFNGETAVGGGGGSGNVGGSFNGGNGGSGGGAGIRAVVSGGTGTAGQGNDGGAHTTGSTSHDFAGGGGGAEAAGGSVSGTASGNGGAGREWPTGSGDYYGGGGGGARLDIGTGPGTGGVGGGGAGNGPADAPGVSGTANTGGGGGGGGSADNDGGDGGSGVAVIRYLI